MVLLGDMSHLFTTVMVFAYKTAEVETASAITSTYIVTTRV
jgi:hypothetical protein